MGRIRAVVLVAEELPGKGLALLALPFLGFLPFLLLPLEIAKRRFAGEERTEPGVEPMTRDKGKKGGEEPEKDVEDDGHIRKY